MSSNPFWDAAEDALRGERVRVQTSDGTYRGLLRLFHYNGDMVLLRDVTTPDEETVPTALVESPQAIEHDPGAASHEIATISIDAIAAQPYSVRDYDDPDFATFVRTIRRDGAIANLPLVRPLNGDGDAEYQVVSGHRRVEALRQTDIDEHPFEVGQFTDWAAAQRFIDEHFPLTPAEREECTDRTSEWYSPELLRASYQRLRDEWDRDTLLAHPAIAENEAIVEAAEGAARDVYEVLVDGTNTEEITGAEPRGSDDATDLESSAAELAAETDGSELRIKGDLMTLLDSGVPLDTAKSALRRKYQ